MKEVIRVRRSISAHFFHGLWTLLTLYKTLYSEPPARYIPALLFAISIVLLLRVIIKGTYLELRGSKLIVNGDFFTTETTEVADIERIEIEAGPFGSSKIFLKDKKKDTIKFSYWNVDIKEFNTLLEQLNVPVK